MVYILQCSLYHVICGSLTGKVSAAIDFFLNDEIFAWPDFTEARKPESSSKPERSVSSIWLT